MADTAAREAAVAVGSIAAACGILFYDGRVGTGAAMLAVVVVAVVDVRSGVGVEHGR